MAEDRMAVLELLRKASAAGDVDFLREEVVSRAVVVALASVVLLSGR